MSLWQPALALSLLLVYLMAEPGAEKDFPAGFLAGEVINDRSETWTATISEKSTTAVMVFTAS